MATKLVDQGTDKWWLVHFECSSHFSGGLTVLDQLTNGFSLRNLQFRKPPEHNTPLQCCLSAIGCLTSGQRSFKFCNACKHRQDHAPRRRSRIRQGLKPGFFQSVLLQIKVLTA